MPDQLRAETTLDVYLHFQDAVCDFIKLCVYNIYIYIYIYIYMYIYICLHGLIFLSLLKIITKIIKVVKVLFTIIYSNFKYLILNKYR